MSEATDTTAQPRKPGRPRVPEDSRKQGVSLSTWIEPRDYDRLLREANARDQKLSAYVRDLLRQKSQR